MKSSKVRYFMMLPILILWVMLSVVGCASTAKADRFLRVDEAIRQSGFRAGVEQIVAEQEASPPLYNEKNVISLFMDKGLLEHYSEDFRPSTESLSRAEQAIQDAFTRSISQSVATYIINDNTREYPGEDFEDIYLSVFNALNYYYLNDIDGALVEIRKLTLPNGKLDMLERKYEAANAKARAEYEQQLAMVENSESGMPTMRSVSFINSALARYLSVLFYQADGNWDAVRIELEQLRQAFATQRDLYKHPIPNAIANIETMPTNEARVDIVSFVGASPIKVEQTYRAWFPFFANSELHYPGLRLPELVARQYRIDRVELVVGDQRQTLELLEDMGAVIIDTYNARYNTIFLKTFLRTLTKYIVLDVSITELKNKYKDANPFVYAAVVTGGIAAMLAVDASERADVRMSRYLPDKAYIGSINLPEGQYDIAVNYYYHGSLVHTERRENVHIRAGRLNLIHAVNLG